MFCSLISAKLRILEEWSQSGKKRDQAGCLLLGYEAFRMLVFYHESKKSKQNWSEDELEKVQKAVSKYLLSPGADLVICDEGHTIKNQKSTTSLAVNQIRTKRRIILTGTPIQNNLKECKSLFWLCTLNVLSFTSNEVKTDIKKTISEQILTHLT